MRTRFPELPSLGPDELGELRTLASIVEHALGSPKSPAVDAAGDAAVERSQPSEQVGARVVQLAPLPLPDAVERQPPDGYVCLMTEDGQGTAQRLAALLEARGWRSVIVTLDDLVADGGANDAERLEAALRALTEQHGPVGAFIHLQPPVPEPDCCNQLFDPADERAARLVFLLAGRLQPWLCAAARSGWAAFVTVTRLDGELGLNGTAGHGAVGGGLAGLTKTLSREWESVYCRAIDLHPDLDAEQAAARIAGEIYDPDRSILEVSHGPRGRMTLATGPLPTSSR
jgi:hypothetical protein